MKKLLVLFVAFGLMFAGAAPAMAQTTGSSTPSTAELLALIEQLKAQVAKLQLQIQQSGGGQGTSFLKVSSQLKRGQSGEEVRLLQRILSTDPSLYPEGLVTGFFGPLTEQALQRLQSKFQLKVKGELDADTIELLNAILEAQGITNTSIPTDLLTSGSSKIEIRIKDGEVEIKVKDQGGNDDEDEDENEDEDDEDEDDELEIEVEIEDGEARVEIDQDGDEDSFTLDTTDHDEIIEEIAERLDITEEEVEDVIEFNDEDEDDEDEDENELEIEVTIEDDEAHVEVEQDGDDDSFTLDTTDEDEIIEEIADRLNIGEDEVEDVIVFHDEDDDEDDD